MYYVVSMICNPMWSMYRNVDRNQTQTNLGVFLSDIYEVLK